MVYSSKKKVEFIDFENEDADSVTSKLKNNLEVGLLRLYRLGEGNIESFNNQYSEIFGFLDVLRLILPLNKSLCNYYAKSINEDNAIILSLLQNIGNKSRMEVAHDVDVRLTRIFNYTQNLLKEIETSGFNRIDDKLDK